MCGSRSGSTASLAKRPGAGRACALEQRGCARLQGEDADVGEIDRSRELPQRLLDLLAARDRHMHAAAGIEVVSLGAGHHAPDHAADLAVEEHLEFGVRRQHLQLGAVLEYGFGGHHEDMADDLARLHRRQQLDPALEFLGRRRGERLALGIAQAPVALVGGVDRDGAAARGARQRLEMKADLVESPDHALADARRVDVVGVAQDARQPVGVGARHCRHEQRQRQQEQ